MTPDQRYDRSAKGRARRRAYNRSEKGCARYQRYNRSEKGRAADERYRAGGRMARADYANKRLGISVRLLDEVEAVLADS